MKLILQSAIMVARLTHAFRLNPDDPSASGCSMGVHRHEQRRLWGTTRQENAYCIAHGKQDGKRLPRLWESQTALRLQWKLGPGAIRRRRRCGGRSQGSA